MADLSFPRVHSDLNWFLGLILEIEFPLETAILFIFYTSERATAVVFGSFEFAPGLETTPRLALERRWMEPPHISSRENQKNKINSHIFVSGGHVDNVHSDLPRNFIRRNCR